MSWKKGAPVDEQPALLARRTSIGVLTGAAALMILPRRAVAAPSSANPSIGLFVDAYRATVPTGIDLVWTTGHGSIGRGQGAYVADRSVDQKYQTANPRSSFISANGRGFRLAEARPTLLHFGAAGDGKTDDRPAFLAALAFGSSVVVPAGDYVIGSPIDFGELAQATGLKIPHVAILGEGMSMSRIHYVGDDAMLIGGANVPARGGYAQVLTMRGLSVLGNGRDGNGSASKLGLFTLTPNPHAGTTSTQTALRWELEPGSMIEGNDIRRFDTAIETKLGYGAIIRGNHIRWNNIGLSLRGAVTTIEVSSNTVERNGIGIALWISARILIQNNVIQGNYAGCDIYSYNWNTMIDIVGNFFEVSPKSFVQHGDSTGEYISNGYRFEGNKGLAVDIIGLASNFHFARNRLHSFMVSDRYVSNVSVEDNSDDENDGLTPFDNYRGAGAKSLQRR